MAARAGVMPTRDPAWPMNPSGGGLPAPPPPSPPTPPLNAASAAGVRGEEGQQDGSAGGRLARPRSRLADDPFGGRPRSSTPARRAAAPELDDATPEGGEARGGIRDSSVARSSEAVRSERTIPQARELGSHRSLTVRSLRASPQRLRSDSGQEARLASGRVAAHWPAHRAVRCYRPRDPLARK